METTILSIDDEETNKTTTEIIEFAEFLGWKYDETEKLYSTCFFEYTGEKYGWSHKLYLSEMKFHSDWNWIMEVKKTIENLDIVKNFIIGTDTVIISLKNSEMEFDNVVLEDEKLISVVCDTMLHFIQWYKKNNI